MRLWWSQKTFLFVVLLVFLVIGVGGAFSSDMMMQDGKMQNCPYMGVTALCTMSHLEHMVAWQSFFVSIPQQSSIALLLSLLAGLLLLPVQLLKVLLPDKRSPAVATFYRYRQREPRVYDQLRLAFARGLIHPKIF